MRHIKVNSGYNLLWLKMRPDTPQHYEYITIEYVQGKIFNFININPWTQFFDLKGKTNIPPSSTEHIIIRKNTCTCNVFRNIKEAPEQYTLADIQIDDNIIEEIGTPSDKTKHTGAE